MIFVRGTYNKYIEDVAMEISQSTCWRDLIMQLEYDTQILISKDSILPLPYYIKDDIIKKDLQFYVSKVKECDEIFDSNLIIFKFQSAEYSDIIRYSGN